jgi:NADH-quinone oxidoreductase subunit M
MQKAFLGGNEAVSVDAHPISPISLPERIAAVILIGVSVAVGLFPQLLLNRIIPALNSPLFDGLRRGSWQ